jgi:GNAT superfamily N-acetyltransferase
VVTAEIREALPQDADAITDAQVAAWRTAYRHAFAAAYLDADSFDADRRSRWRDRLCDGPPRDGDPHNRIVVPVVDGQVVGFAHIGREYTGSSGFVSPRGEVCGFYIHPDAWGTGAATTLIEHCQDELGTRFSRAVLWVLEDNPRARRFYERSGWSCGAGDDVVTTWWSAPAIPGLAAPSPVLEVQYRLDLRSE